MTEKRIAGHIFADTSTGRRCIALNPDGLVCRRSWLSIKDSTACDLGKQDIAHVGALNDGELAAIIEERTREENKVWEAVQYAASAGSH